MEALNNINIESLTDTLISLTTAFVLGSVIGIERHHRQRTAGLLRTNVLVTVGAAVFVDMANRLTGHEGAVHVAAYVVSGIGFLGAGVIMKGDDNVRGLNTAATLWAAAAVGACAGADLIAEAALAALFVLAGNTLLRPAIHLKRDRRKAGLGHRPAHHNVECGDSSPLSELCGDESLHSTNPPVGLNNDQGRMW